MKEEIERIKKEYYADDPHAIVSMMGVQIEEIARHFANWQKQQMMKNAVEANVHPYDGEIWAERETLKKYSLEDNEDIKIIIIKEE